MTKLLTAPDLSGSGTEQPGTFGDSNAHLAHPRENWLSPRELRILREKFISNPEITDLSALRPVIERSWRRSLMWKVDPFREDLGTVEEPKLDELVRRCAEPILKNLARLAADTGSGIYLSDPHGTVVDFRGDLALRRLSEKVFPVMGASMSEDVVGTNAEGTAIEEGRSIQIWGAEHFSVGLEGFCCTAVPIRDPMRGSVRGFITLTIPNKTGLDVDPKSIAFIVEAAAAEITRALADHLAVREKTLLDTYLSEVRKRGGESVVVMDDRTTIATRSAIQMLKQEDYAVLAGYARESTLSQLSLDRSIVLGNDRKISLQALPITSKGQTIGSLLRLKPAELKPPKSKTSGPLEQSPFAEIIGENLMLRRATELAQTAVNRQMSAHITGQAGTGKLRLAKAMAAKMSQEVLVLDGANEHDYAKPLSEEFNDGLERGAAVILQHVGALSEPTKVSVSESLARHAGKPVIFTSSKLDVSTLEMVRLLGGVEIEIPPLRLRREDITRLAQYFLKSNCHGISSMAPTFMRALAEADWPGNVGQLKDFINSAAARCTSPELSLELLTDSQRKALEGKRLSRLEEVELQQIRAALEESGGNRVRAAELLEIGRSTLYRKIDSYTRRGFVIVG